MLLPYSSLPTLLLPASLPNLFPSCFSPKPQNLTIKAGPGAIRVSKNPGKQNDLIQLVDNREYERPVEGQNDNFRFDTYDH